VVVALPRNLAVWVAHHVEGRVALSDHFGQAVDRVAGGYWLARHTRAVDLDGDRVFTDVPLRVEAVAA